MRLVKVAIFPVTVLLTSSLVFSGSVYAAGIDYSGYEKVLNTYVDDKGRVDYAALKADRKGLDSFIESQVKDADVASLNSTGQMAFWINAYNALTLRLIIDNYPLLFGGIRTINWGRPWSIKMDVAGRRLSLGEIEHEILRKWDPIDPRIHFAINCASVGCPVLPATHFDPARLDAQLDAAARDFVNNPDKVRVDRQKGVLYYSEIFKWFDEDFLAVAPDLKSYIMKYINADDRKYLQDHAVKLKTIDYDWSLNDQK